MQSRSRIIWVVLGVLVIGFYVAWASWRVHIDDSDLIDFHQTSLHWWQTGQFSQEFGVRHYLPAFVVLIAPLVAWPLALTAPLWTLLNIGMLLLALRACGRVIAAPPHESPPFSVRWIWPMVLVLPYLHSTIGLGQVNILVLCLCVLALTRPAGRKQEALAGLLVALAGVIKIYPLVLILFWLARGRWRTSLAAAVCFVLLAGGLSLTGFGWQGSREAHRLWLAEVRGEQYIQADEPRGGLPRHLMFLPGRNQFLRHNNQSLAAVVRRLTTDLGPHFEKDRPVNIVNLSVRQSQAIYLAMAGGVLILLLWTTWRGRRSSDPLVALRQGSAWLAGVIAFIPIYWTHYFILLLPAVTVLTAEVWARRQRKSRWGLPEVLFIAWLLAIPLLGVNVLRLMGFHCWLALATMVWTMESRTCRNLRADCKAR